MSRALAHAVPLQPLPAGPSPAWPPCLDSWDSVLLMSRHVSGVILHDYVWVVSPSCDFCCRPTADAQVFVLHADSPGAQVCMLPLFPPSFRGRAPPGSLPPLPWASSSLVLSGWRVPPVAHHPDGTLMPPRLVRTFRSSRIPLILLPRVPDVPRFALVFLSALPGSDPQCPCAAASVS